MKVVVDTNVLVSSTMSPWGPPARILDLILSQRITLLISSGILQEYIEVMGRKEFSFDKTSVRNFLYALALASEKVAEGPLKLSLPDPDDEIFLSCALEGKADHLITGNKKHFPDHLCRPTSIVSPREFLQVFTGA